MDLLEQLLEDYPDLKLIWTASNLKKGEARLTSEIPDLLFLDIELPDGLGLDFLEKHSKLLANTYVIMFTGQYDAYKDQAFERNECDYLLKPIMPKELDKCIQRLRHTDLKKRISSSKESNVDCAQTKDTFAAFTPMNEKIGRAHV